MIGIVFFMYFVSMCNGLTLDLPEGSPCEWMGAQGVCVNVRRCFSFPFDREANRHPPLCSFQDKTPIICCVDCQVLTANLTVQDELDDDRYKTGRKYEENCLTYEYLLPYSCKIVITDTSQRKWNEERKCYAYRKQAIAPVGGEDALRGDFPHMALLGYGEDLETVLCGGSLISDRHILTAAHCGSHISLGAVKYVALGMLKRSDPPRFWKRYKVKVFLPHPDYKSPGKYHDIAIIETETTVNLTDGVRPACLTHKDVFRGDDLAYATGWGSLGPRKENADVMQKVFLKKFTAEECASLYPPHRHLAQGYNHSSQMCYGDKDLIRDTCEGDSGGPLQKRDPDAEYCVYVVIGVTSYGRACGAVGSAGMYTRVSYYLPWIEGVVWP